MIKLKSGVVCQVISGETVLLDVGKGTYFDLNATGTLMLQSLLAGGSAQAAIAAVLDRYEAEPSVVSEDFNRLMADLQKADLIESLE